MRLGVIGLDPQRLLVVCDGLLDLACLRQSVSQTIVRVGVIGFNPQGLLEVCHRRRQLTHLQQSIAETHMSTCIVLAFGDRILPDG